MYPTTNVAKSKTSVEYLDLNFSEMTAMELLCIQSAQTYDNASNLLSNEAKAKIWTHIASHFEGLSVYDEKFTMNDFEGNMVHFGNEGAWHSSWATGSGRGTVTGSGGYSYETTVENVASSIIVHEWYSHLKKDNRTTMNSHRLAYKNVINFKYFWDMTTDAYKKFNLEELKRLTKDETGRLIVDPLYRNLYKKYINP